MDGTDCIFTWQDKGGGRFVYEKDSSTTYFIYPDGEIDFSKSATGNRVFSDITTTAGGELVPQWMVAAREINKN